jgi:hypothetical protein
MIDKETGSISFGNVVLGPSTERRQFLKALPNAHLMLENAGHRTYRVGALDANGDPFVICPRFHYERLAVVTVVASDDRFGGSWEDWSSDREEARKQHHDQWLSDVCGLAGDAAVQWGSVVSHFNERAGASEILIQYAG